MVQLDQGYPLSLGDAQLTGVCCNRAAARKRLLQRSDRKRRR
jgi:hypothetical protein